MSEFSDNGKTPVPGAVRAATPAPPTDTDIAFAQARDLVKLAGNGSNKKNWIVQLLIAIIAIAGTAFAAYKATEARSVSNEHHVEENKKSIESNTEAIGEVKTSVDNVAKSVDLGLKGIEQLKREARTAKQKAIEDELADLKRENQILKRNR